MENFPGILPESDDDEEAGIEKRKKKDAKEVLRKASLLEIFNTEASKAEKKESEKSKEKEATPEEVGEMDEGEEKIVAEQLVEDRLEAVESELEQAPEGSSEEIEAAAATSFLEKVGAKLDKGEKLDTEILDEAVAEATAALGIEQAENLEEHTSPELESDVTAENIESDVPEELEDDSTIVITPAGGSGGTKSSGTNGGSLPPIPPISPASPVFGGQFGVGPGSMGPIGGAGLASPNILAPTPNIVPAPSQESSHSHLKYVLTGGLLGYLIGRRRGRIKTEARLMPVQRKLEEQVTSMNEELVRREETIRKLALENRQELASPDRFQTQKVIIKERAKRAEALKVIEQNVQNQPEKLGKFALIPEAVLKTEKSREIHADKTILEIARQISIEGTTLESLYRNGKIEIKDVREIVAAYLSGNSYEKLLAKSLKPDYRDGGLVGGGVDIGSASGASQNSIYPGRDWPAGVREDLQFRNPTPMHSNYTVKVIAVAGTVTIIVGLAVVITLLLLDAL